MPEHVDSQMVEQEPHHTNDHAFKRSKQGRHPETEKPELRLTSMVDVIFLLLIFFVITANFIQDEGTLLATLPGTSTGPSPIPPPPMLIELVSADDGVSYTLKANGRSFDSVTQLYEYLVARLGSDMKPSDPVEINPQGVVRWQHVLNVYNACVRAELQAVSFASS